MKAVALKYYLVFLLLSAVPSMLQILFDLSSYTQGFAVNVILVLCIVLLSKQFARYLRSILIAIRLKVYIYIGLVTLLHFGIIIFRWYIGAPVDFIKFIVGLVMFVGLGLQAAYLSYIVIKIVYLNENIAITLFVLTYLIFGIIGIYGYTVFGPITSGKPVLFFSEISHYAINLVPLYCVWTILTKRWYVRWSGHLTTCLIGYYYQSTTLFIALLSVIYVTSKAKIVFAVTVIALCVLAFGGEIVTYYTSRLSFRYNEDAYQNWVSLQGWQDAFLNFTDTYGFGVGLQQFGIMEPRGEFALAVYKIVGVYVNRFDGSFGAAKIIGEFGMIGIIVVVFLTVQFMRAAIKLRSYNGKILHGKDQIIDVYADSFIYVFFIYLFIRGGGYFGPNCVFVVSGLILKYLPRTVSTLRNNK